MNSIKITESAEASFFCAQNYSAGYAGLQQTPDKKFNKVQNIFISSMWDTPLKEKATVLYKDPNVFAERFGGEGTGQKCVYPYNWLVNRWYTIVQRAWQSVVDTGEDLNVDTFIVDDQGKWVHTATVARPSDGLTGLGTGFGSFLENWISDNNPSHNGQIKRKAFFKNTWIQNSQRQWEKPAKVTVSVNDLKEDVARNGPFHKRFNATFDAKEGAYMMEHGGTATPSASFKGGRTLDLPLPTNQEIAPALPKLTDLTDWMAYSSYDTVHVHWKWNEYTTPIARMFIRLIDSEGGQIRLWDLEGAGNKHVEAQIPGLAPGQYEVRIEMVDIFGRGTSVKKTSFTVSKPSSVCTHDANSATVTVTGNTANFSMQCQVYPSGRSKVTLTNLPNGRSYLIEYSLYDESPLLIETNAIFSSKLTVPSLGLNKTIYSLPVKQSFFTPKPIAVVQGKTRNQYLTAGKFTNDRLFYLNLFPLGEGYADYKIQFLKLGTRFDTYKSKDCTGGVTNGKFISTVSNETNLFRSFFGNFSFTLTTMGVSVYQHLPKDGYGWRSDFPLGSFNKQTFVANGAADDQVSFIRIFPGYKVTLFDEDLDRGRRVVYANPTYATSMLEVKLTDENFNDKTSAIRVEVSPMGMRTAAEDSTVSTINNSTIDVEHKATSSLTVYPNPAQEKAFVKINSITPAKGNLQVVSTSGRVMFSQSISLERGINTVDIPLGSMPDDTYLIKVVTDTFQHSARLIKSSIATDN